MSRKLLVSVVSLVLLSSIAESAFIDSISACYLRIPASSEKVKVPRDLCSHAILSGYEVLDDGQILAPVNLLSPQIDNDDAVSVSTITQITSTKYLIGIGDWTTTGSMHSFHNMINNETSRTTFVKNAVSILSNGRYKGINILYNYPAMSEYEATDKENFALLLSELRAAFENKDYTLTASVSANIVDVATYYNVSGLTENLNYVFLHAHDYYGKWSNITGPNAPTYFISNEEPFNVNSSIAQWIDSGVPASKLVLGASSAGSTFTLSDPKNAGVGALISGPGKAGSYSKIPGLLGYSEICSAIKDNIDYGNTDDDGEETRSYGNDGLVAGGDNNTVTIDDTDKNADDNDETNVYDENNSTNANSVGKSNNATNSYDFDNDDDDIDVRSSSNNSSNSSKWTVTEVPDSYVYASKNLSWLGYDNEKTIYAKGKLARKWKLAGVYMWALDLDDTIGKCGTPYPLLNQLIAGYNSDL